MRTALFRISTSLVALLVGSVAAADIPRDAQLGPDYAEVTFVRGAPAEKKATRVQTYSKAYDQHCLAKEKVAEFARSKGKDKASLVETGRPTLFYAETAYLDFRSSGAAVLTMRERTCANRVFFTPQPGGRYSIKQTSLSPESCSLEVVDLATGAEPEGLTHSTKPYCSYIKGLPVE
ncbi:hypothetical protein [Parerythrobacter aestuarii]|uniref:hypothetical protein n=1 Tax=Parerythrobacter aestuarii TaxID=3020909 RepID=UPI0024DE5F27|nr:hypothetical protein [Parerythrobacter aestuarii]